MGDYVRQQLGAYRLIKLLGSGGFADVYLGEHVYLNTKAAIKVLHTRLVEQDVASFRNEARTIAQLAHPNIVRVLDFNIEGDTPYLVLDYAPNGTLRQRHPKGSKLPLSTVVFYVKQVAGALHYAHNLKIVHRDVKPENILLGRGNEILLSDFGIAIIAQTSQHAKALDAAGTISYMAPEQIRGLPQPASDQYALSIITYEWLCGRRPFNGTFTEIAAMQSMVKPAPLSSFIQISPQVEQVVLKALEKEPSQRFINVEEFAKALEAAAEEVATERTTTKKAVFRETATKETESSETATKAVESASISSASLVRKRVLSRKSILITSLSLIVIFALAMTGLSRWASFTQGKATANNNDKAIAEAAATEKVLLAHSYTTNTAAGDNTVTTPVAGDAPSTAIVAANPNPYPPGRGNLALYDSLSQSDSKWSEGQNSSYGGDCEFAQGAYQISQSKPNGLYLCRDYSGDFGNFVFEVQMTVIKGDCGGIFFRYSDKDGSDYLFTVCHDSYYALYVYLPGDPTKNLKALFSDSSQAIHTGYNQSNVLAVVANGNQFDLYVNKQKVHSVNDATYSYGSVGMIAITDGHYTSDTILYRNARIWTL